MSEVTTKQLQFRKLTLSVVQGHDNISYSKSVFPLQLLGIIMKNLPASDSVVSSLVMI